MPNIFVVILGVVVRVNALTLDKKFFNLISFEHSINSNVTRNAKLAAAAAVNSTIQSNYGGLSGFSLEPILAALVFIVLVVVYALFIGVRIAPVHRNQTAVVWLTAVQHARQNAVENAQTDVELEAWRSESTINELPPSYFPTRSSPVEDEHDEYHGQSYASGSSEVVVENHRGDAVEANKSVTPQGVDFLNHDENEVEPPSYARVAAQGELRRVMSLVLQTGRSP